MSEKQTVTEPYTIAAAAKVLGISHSLAYGLCKAGKIRHERHGLGRGTIRITREALEQYRRSVARPEHQPGGATACPSS